MRFQEWVICQRLVEVLVKVEEVYDVQLDRICLIIELVLDISDVSVGSGNDVSCVLRTVLIIVGQFDICSWYRTGEVFVRQQEELRKTKSSGYSELVRPYRIIELCLKVTHETQIKPLATTENILMII